MKIEELIETKEYGRGDRLTQLSKSIQNEYHNFLDTHKSIPSQYPYNLTIGHDPKFIWFRNAKVGTRTILSFLRHSNFKLSAEQAHGCHYPIAQFSEYFKFGFVRNPWDRFVSGWLNKIVRKNSFNLSEEERNEMMHFDNYIDYWSNKDLKSCNVHFRLQSRLIDLNEVDLIGRLENFSEDLLMVLNKLQIPLREIPHNNKTKRRSHYSSYYSKKSRELIGEMYEKDISLFGYQFENKSV